MSVNIVKVDSKKQLDSFIKFGYELYKNNPYYVSAELLRGISNYF